MGVLGFLSNKSATKVDELIAQLKEPVAKPAADNNFGFAKDEKIVDELAKLKDPQAIPGLDAKTREIQGFLDVMEMFSPATRDMRLYQALTALRDKAKQVIVAFGGREVAFVLPCAVCNKRTRVTVTMDFAGHVLSGTETDQEFHCQFCKKAFTVSKNGLKPYTNRFI